MKRRHVRGVGLRVVVKVEEPDVVVCVSDGTNLNEPDYFNEWGCSDTHHDTYGATINYSIINNLWAPESLIIAFSDFDYTAFEGVYSGELIDEWYVEYEDVLELKDQGEIVVSNTEDVSYIKSFTFKIETW